MRLAFFLLLALVINQNGDCAKILGIISAPSFSHYQLGQIIYNELSRKGHEVTVLSPFPSTKDDQFKVIELPTVVDFLEGFRKNVNFFNMKFDALLGRIFVVHSLGLSMTEATLKDPNMQAFLKTNETFDLVVMEQFVNDAMRGLAHKFNAPCIIISTVASNYWFNSYVGNPVNPAYMADMALRHVGYMDFWMRFKNTLVTVLEHVVYHYYILRKHDTLMHEYFPDAPPLKELLYDTSLALINSHPMTAAPMPLVANAIEIGGYHVKPPKKLPEDLQKFLDNAEEGVVFFSMGSNLRSKDIPIEKRKIILNALGKIGKKVIWKFEESLAEKPSNVYIYKWLPQQEILAHPNVLLFITHGGLLSTIEATYHGVPVIGIPIYGDQETNMQQTLHAGTGLVLNYSNLTEENFYDAIKEILNNKKYSKNAKLRSKIFHDRPIKPLDLATYWIEYVLRYDGAKHLRSPALDLHWWQLLLLDIILFTLISYIIVIKIVKLIFKSVCRRNKSKAATNDDKKRK